MKYVYRGREIELNDDIFNTHKVCFGSELQEWRADTYICAEYSIKDTEIDNILSKLKKSDLENILNFYMKSDIKICIGE